MLKNRSYQAELIDAEDIAEADLVQTYKELHRVNTLLGGYAISRNAIASLPAGKYKLVDIGCGSGDMLQALSKQRSKHIELELHGLDIKDFCIDYAKQHVSANVQWYCADYKDLFAHIPKANIVHACLFFHHLPEDQIIALIKECLKHNAIFISNDLERNPIAYHSIRILTSIFSRSHLVRNDAPLSVHRGFKKREWEEMIIKAGARKYKISNRWAFRHQVIVYE